MVLIQGPDALAQFRATWTGPRLLELLQTHQGRLYINWAVGVGKSRSLDAVVPAALASGRYDLVVVLAPTQQVLQERRWVHQPPASVRVVHLRARPRQRCGPELDAAWRLYEQGELGALGRVELCGRCPARRGCAWPEQYGQALAGVQVIFATQVQLQRAPAFSCSWPTGLARRGPWCCSMRSISS